jgi:hypothetical protein
VKRIEGAKVVAQALFIEELVLLQVLGPEEQALGPSDSIEAICRHIKCAFS